MTSHLNNDNNSERKIIIKGKIYMNELQKRKQRMTKIWDKVAPKFSKSGATYWDDFGKRLIENACINEGSKLLDIGVGRGGSLFPALEKVGTKGHVVGIDLSQGMVDETHKEIINKNITNAEVRQMDFENLGFNDNTFDNIIGGFVISYIHYSEKKFSDILRVLKEGGQIGFSQWGVQKDQEWLVEIMNKFSPKNSNNHKNDNKNSSQEPQLNTIEGVEKIILDYGFKNVKVFEECNDVIYRTKEEWWQDMWNNAVRGYLDKIEKQGEDKFQKLKDDLFKGLDNFRHEEEFLFRMPVIYVFGEK